MKRILMILFIAFTCDLAYSPDYKAISMPVREAINPYLRLCDAIAIVESNDNDSAYNALELATGRLQIRPILVRDYNQRTGGNHLLSDMYDPNISRKLFMYYSSKYKPYDYEGIAKKWNGIGKSNEVYWARVNSVLQGKKVTK